MFAYKPKTEKIRKQKENCHIIFWCDKVKRMHQTFFGLKV